MENFKYNLIKKLEKVRDRISPDTRNTIAKHVNLAIGGFPSEIDRQLTQVKDFLREQVYTQLHDQPQKKLSDEEIQNIGYTFAETKNLSREQRIEKIKDIRETLNWFRKELAQRESKIIRQISEQPLMSEDTFRGLVHEIFSDFPLNDRQQEQLGDIVDTFCLRHETVIEMRQQFPNDNDLFTELVGVPPMGEVEIITTPISFYIRAQDKRDYTKIYHLGNVDWSCVDMTLPEIREQFKYMHQAANRSGGVKIYAALHDSLKGGGIIAENADSSYFVGSQKRTFIHEHQHALHTFFDEKVERICDDEYFSQRAAWISDNNPEQLRALLQECYESRLLRIEKYAKDEILAYYQDSTMLNDIPRILTDPDGLYNYFERSASYYTHIPFISLLDHPDYQSGFVENVDSIEVWRKRIKILEEDIEFRNEKIAAYVPEIAHKVFKESYYQHLYAAMESIKQLEKTGLARSVIVRLLTHEPLHAWSKLVRHYIKTIER